MDLARALQFLVRMLGRPDHRPGEPVELLTRDGPVAADLYRPARPWATVLVLHGLALMGHRDPRLTNIGHALAGAGVFAIAPRLDALARLRLQPPASDTIAAIFDAVANDPELGAPARIGVFGPSYSGSQALHAVARPELRDRASGLLLVGPYADARHLLTHVLHDDDADPYGRLILLRHFLAATDDLTEGVASAIDTNLEDLGIRPDAPELDTLLPTLSQGDRERFLALRDQVAVRDALAEQILREHGDLVDELSITGALPHVEAPVVLLHGAHDPVIPPSESELIHRTLRAAGRSSRMVATPLLDHGNVMAQGRALLDVPRVVGAFTAWFRSLRRR